MNRTLGLESQKIQRKNARKTKIDQLLNDLRLAEPPAIEVDMPNPAPPSMSGCCGSPFSIGHQRIFPAMVGLLDRPIMANLVETDVSVPEMEACFWRHRKEIDTYISEWRRQTEGYLAKLLQKGRASDGLKAAPASVLPAQSELHLFTGISANLKVLLRADSLFESTNGPNLAPLNYYCLLVQFPLGKLLDLNNCKRHAEAQMFARAFLAELGKPDACFLELETRGAGFMCARCHSNSIFKWEDMVRSRFIIYMLFLIVHLCRSDTTWTRNEPGGSFKLGFQLLRNSELLFRTSIL